MGWHWGDLTSESGGQIFGGGTGYPASHVFNAEGTQHVFHTVGPNVIELWWRGGDTPQTGNLSRGGAPLAAGDLASHVFDAEGTQHVFYRTSDGRGTAAGHIAELWWRGSEIPHPRSLTSQSGEPSNAVSSPASHVFEAEGTQHVFYRTFEGHIIELWWTGGTDGTPQARSLTQQAGALLAAGDPASHVFHAEATQHVFHRTGSGHIVELWWRNSGEAPQARDLTELSGGALLAAGDPVSHVFNAEGTQHVFYTADNGHIVELWWTGGTNGTPHFEDLTERSGRPPVPAGRLTSHVFDAEGTQHVFFRTASFSPQLPDPAIVELWWKGGGAPQFENVNERSGSDAPLGQAGPGAPPPEGDPISHVFAGEGTQHVFFASSGGGAVDPDDILELWFKG